MANRFVLNETSYHGVGAIKSIPEEIKGRGLKKAFVCSDPDLKEIVKPEDVDFLAQSAYDDACRPGNPRETSVAEIKELYLSLM